jgi:2',3'-cyclic-nucleotide 2'-phosphodiesterase (5'-nucleotidase family)
MGCFLAIGSISLGGSHMKPLNALWSFAVSVGISIGLYIGLGAFAAPAHAVPITIFHTNDLHSHLRPEKTPLALGGIARLKTAIDRGRKDAPHSLLVDGGDWSEGNIYYTEGAGAEVLRMMDRLGYDAAIVGNHDWVNGPDTLLATIEKAKPKVSLLVSNFDLSAYPKQQEFQQDVLPYVIKEVNGVKIAFIGMATYEFIYNQLIAPIKIIEPFELAHQLAMKLRKQADAVIVISHNRVLFNEGLLRAAPEIDLVIGAHDHVKLTEPKVVKRSGHSDGWIVETGCWGKYLGRVDLDIDPSILANKGEGDAVKLVNYHLTQIDRTIPDDPGTLKAVVELEKHIENRMGPIFHDHIGDTQVELAREGSESLIGDLVSDSYRKATGAQIGLDIKAFVYGMIHEGPVTSADAFNANPAVWDPQTERSWNIKTVKMSGKKLLLLIKFASMKVSLFTEGVYISGATLEKSLTEPSSSIDPDNQLTIQTMTQIPPQTTIEDQSTFSDEIFGKNPFGSDLDDIASTKDAPVLLIDGKPIVQSQDYLIATGEGMLQTVAFINSLISNLIPTDTVQDSGLEAWRVLADSVEKLSPVILDKLAIKERIKSPHADLKLFYDDVAWEPIRKGHTTEAMLHVRVKNYGESASSATGNQITLSVNRNGNNLALATDLQAIGEPLSVPALNPGEERELSQKVELTEDRGVFSVNVELKHNDSGTETTDSVLRYFQEQ